MTKKPSRRMEKFLNRSNALETLEKPNYIDTQRIYSPPTDSFPIGNPFFESNSQTLKTFGLLLIEETYSGDKYKRNIIVKSTDIYGRVIAEFYGDDADLLLDICKESWYEPIREVYGLENFADVNDISQKELIENILKASGGFSERDPNSGIADAFLTMGEGSSYIKKTLPDRNVAISRFLSDNPSLNVVRDNDDGDKNNQKTSSETKESGRGVYKPKF